VTIVTPGAGGYGPAAERDRALVERDVREGKVSRSAAAEIYRAAAGMSTSPHASR
jgi:N-methylhydantoinase B